MTRSLPLGRLAAEFVVIVIGVLVALGVDAWNTARVESERGEMYLERLAEDLETQIAQIDARAADVEAQLAGGDSLKAMIAGAPPPGGSLRETFFDLFGENRFEVPRSDSTAGSSSPGSCSGTPSMRRWARFPSCGTT